MKPTDSLKDLFDTRMDWLGQDELKRFAEMMAEQVRLQSAEVRACFDSRDGVKLRFAAHSLVNATVILRRKNVYEAACRVERLAVNGNLDEAEPAVQELQLLLQHLLESLAALDA